MQCQDLIPRLVRSCSHCSAAAATLPCPALPPCSPAALQSIQTPEFNNSLWLHIQAKCQNLISKPSIQNLLHRYRYYLGGGLVLVGRSVAQPRHLNMYNSDAAPRPATSIHQSGFLQAHLLSFGPFGYSDIQWESVLD